MEPIFESFGTRLTMSYVFRVVVASLVVEGMMRD